MIKMRNGYQEKKKGGNNQRHLKRDIIKAIKELIQGGNDGNVLAAEIKRKYKLISKGKAEIDSEIKQIAETLFRNYGELSQYNAINEIILKIIQQYESSLENKSDEEKEKGKGKIFYMHARILGNPGTNSQGMSIEYIEQIVRWKIVKARGIDSEDLINLLEQQGQSMFGDIEAYQKLINDTIVNYIDLYKREDGKSPISNCKVLKILLDLARSYRAQKKDAEALKIYEKGLRFKEFEGTDEYKEMADEYEKCKSCKEILNQNFDVRNVPSDFENIGSYQEFLERLGVKTGIKVSRASVKIFDGKSSKGEDQIPVQEENGTRQLNVMDNELKFKAMQRMVRGLRERGYKVEIKEVMVGKEGYKGYFVFPLDGTYISALEQFSEKRNAAFYLMKDSNREEIIRLTRTDARKRDDIGRAEHNTYDFEGYVEKMISEAIGLMNQIGISPTPKNYVESKTQSPIQVSPRVKRLMELEEQKANANRMRETEQKLRKNLSDKEREGRKGEKEETLN